MTKPSEPEYLYAVVDGAFAKPVVERVRVSKRTKKGVWFIDRERAVGYRAAMTHDEVRRILSATPDGAVAKWRENLQDYVRAREEEISRVRAELARPNPKNAWEKK